jgi:hypothetical protein
LHDFGRGERQRHEKAQMAPKTGTDAAGVDGDLPEPRNWDATGRMSVWRRLAPAIGLTLLAPLIGEFLLGNISITAIFGLVFLAPLYGCGALLIRESARYTGRGWPTMIVIGVAYALFEEGLVTQFLFNPSYHGLDLQGAAYVPALGIGVRLTVTIIALHAIWSTCVPIALVEALVPARSTTPWLGQIGLAVTGVVFLVGSAYLFYTEYIGQRFLASRPQLIGTMLIIVALIALAFRIGRCPRRLTTGPVPNPWIVGAAALVTTSLLLLGLDAPAWLGVGIGVALLAAASVLIWHWAGREGWGAAHRLALAGGALLTYAWMGFVMPPLDEEPGTIDLIGNAVFAAGAIVLLAVAIRTVHRANERA